MAPSGESRRSTLPRKHLLEFTLSFANNQAHVVDHRSLLAECGIWAVRLLNDCYYPKQPLVNGVMTTLGTILVTLGLAVTQLAEGAWVKT